MTDVFFFSSVILFSVTYFKIQTILDEGDLHNIVSLNSHFMFTTPLHRNKWVSPPHGHFFVTENWPTVRVPRRKDTIQTIQLFVRCFSTPQHV